MPTELDETLTFEFQANESITSIQTVSITFAQNDTYSMEGIAAAINEAVEATLANTGLEATVVDGTI